MTKRKHDHFSADPYRLRIRARLSEQAADRLEAAFIWADSREDVFYWDRIWRRLEEIASDARETLRTAKTRVRT